MSSYLRLEEEMAPGGQPVPAGPPDLLDVRLERLGHVVVDDGADVGLVDAHPEGNGSHDHSQPAIIIINVNIIIITIVILIIIIITCPT